MTKDQFQIIASLLALSDEARDAIYGALYNNTELSSTLTGTLDRVRQADLAIRGAYVWHGPMEFRIVVGHRDTHRAPGALTLCMGDIVKLVAQSTERWICARITALPDSPAGYYRGIIIKQLVKSSRYQVGNGVKFSEDQVLTDASPNGFYPKRLLQQLI